MSKWFFVFEDPWSVLVVVVYLLSECDMLLKTFLNFLLYLFACPVVVSVSVSLWVPLPTELSRHPQMCFFIMKSCLSFLECFPKSCSKQLFFPPKPFKSFADHVLMSFVSCPVSPHPLNTSISLNHFVLSAHNFTTSQVLLAVFHLVYIFCDTGWRLCNLKSPRPQVN